MSLLEVNIIRQRRKFTTFVKLYHKPTFSGICTFFDSFLPSTFKIDMIQTLLHRRFQICSSWTKFDFQLVKLLEFFKSNGYSENFVNNCFIVFLDIKDRIQETKTKLRKFLKGILNCYKLQIVFKSQNKLENAFRFKVCIPKEFISGVL